MPQTSNNRWERFGFKVKLPNGKQIPLNKKVSNIPEESMKKQPPAWRAETNSNSLSNVNNYRKAFRSALIRRHSWQYCFAGLLRAVFGIYSSQRYWRRDLEVPLMEAMKAEYEETKRVARYGIYAFKAKKAVAFTGRLWKNGQPPKGYTKMKTFWIATGGIFYARVDRFDKEKSFVDIEVLPYWQKEPVIVRIVYKMFKWQLTNNLLKRLNDGKIWKLKRRSRKPEPKG